MNYYSLSALLNSITLTILGVFVFFRNRKSIVNQTYVLFCLFIAAWSYCYFIWQISLDSISALFWCRALMVWAIFIPVTYLHFVLNLIGKIKERIRSVYLGYFLSISFALLSFTPVMIKDVKPRMSFAFWPTAGILYSIYLAYFALYAYFAIAIIYKEYVRSIDIKRNQYKYILVGTVIGYIGGATNYPLWYDIKIPPYGNILISVYVALVGYAIVRYRLMDVRIFLTRIGIFVSVYALILGLPFWLGFKTELWILATALMGVLASLGPYFFNLLQRKAENILLAQQKHYQNILLQASGGMVREHDLNRLLKLIVYVLRRAVKIKFAAAFIDDKNAGAFILKAIRDGRNHYEGVMFNYDHPFVRYMQQKKETFMFAEMPQDVRDSIHVDMAFNLIVPSFIENRCIGFLALGSKLNNTVYTQDDINVFITLSNQAALAIENCIFVQEFKKTQERLFNAEKLASIGGMADGVAHQMKNRMNILSLAAGEQSFELDDVFAKHAALLEKTPELKESLDYIRKGSESIRSNIKKTNGILQGILDFAKTEEKGSSFSEFALSPSIEQVVNLVKVKHQLAEFPLQVEIAPPDSVYGVQAQVLESIYNILDNAYEAVREKMEYHLTDGEKNRFQPEIRLKLSHREQADIIQISDNGMGVKDENRNKIFAPFFTTKSSAKSGSGIGMYVVKRMIEEHHQGKVRFESVYGKGITFFIELPRKTGRRISSPQEPKDRNDQPVAPL